jgi:tRNA (guanine37-N1)-methyltransferase
MVMKCEPIFAAVEEIKAGSRASPPSDSGVAVSAPEPSRVIYLSPSGRRLTHAVAAGYAEARGHLILLCGHYEGVDHRVVEHLVDDEISIGDYVLTNGAIAAAVFVDAVARLIPGVLGDENSAAQDSFAQGLLEGPQYTRPVEFRGWRVPGVLLSGNHAQIAQWRAAQAMEKTRRIRPDLLG